MEKVVRKFDSFEAADKADAEWDAALTPQQRIDVVLQLRAQRHPDAAFERLARVYRIERN